MRRGNLYYRVAVVLGVVALGVVAVVVLSHAFDLEVVSAADKVLSELATVLGIATGFAGLLGKRESAAHQSGDDSRRWAPAVPARVDPSQVLPPRQSVEVYVAQYRRWLQDLSADDHRFVPLSTVRVREEAKEQVRREVQRAMRPRLSYERRDPKATYVQAQQEPVDLFEVQHKFTRAVLLGEPGSGKSTCIREIALRELETLERQAAAATDEELTRLRLPVLVSLTDWADSSVPALDFLRSRLAALAGETNYFVHHFQSLVTSGRFLFLLDGLNEMPGRRASTAEGRHHEQPGGPRDQPHNLAPRPGPAMDPRERSLRDLAAQTAVQCPFVLTCRSHEYFDSMQWVAVHVLPMNDAQIEAFVRAYLPPDRAAALIEQVAGKPDLRALAVNPFFLVGIITVHRPGLDLTSRGQVLQHLLITLLERERERGAGPEGELEELEERVGRVALRMLRQGAIGNQAPVDSRDERDLRPLTGTGLIIERHQRLFFSHQIVQEFFAACALRGRRIPSPIVKRLLADKRYSETILVWRDLDPDRMHRRLVRALRARNLPWRRPRSPGSVPLQAFNTATTVIITLVLVWYALEWATWHAEVMSPSGVLPVTVPLILLALVALRLIWGGLVPHQKVIVNAGYVLSQTGRPAAVIDLVRSFPRVFMAPRQELAQSIAAFGPPATPHVVDGLGSKNWRVRWGSVQALGEILRRRPDDDLATRSLLLLPSADDPKLVRPLTEALVWCRDPRVPEAIAAVLQLAGRSPLLAGARLEPLGRIRYTLESSAVDEQLTGRLLDTMTSDAPPIIRGTTALVVGMLQPPGWEARLAALATDAGQVDAVRDYAIKALGLAQTTPGIELVVHAAEGRYGGAWPAVQTTLQAVTRPEALPGLATAAASSRWWVREAAAVSIGRIGTDEAMELLRELAADGDSDVRKATVSGLLLANRSDAVPLLCRLAADTDHSVRSRAVDVLWTQYPDLAVTPLIEVATEPAHPARAEAIDLLGRFDRPDAEAALLALAADPDRAIREAAERSGTAREVAGGHRGRAWLRHPLTALTHGVKDWLEWDGVRQMWDEERLAGTPGSLIGARLTSRISLDAELTRRFRHAMRAFSVAFVVVAVLLTALAMLLARACLWLSHVMVDHWVITSVVVALGVLTLVPGVRNLEDTGLGGWLVPVLQLAAMAVVVVAVVGVLTYTWWIWLGVLLAAGSAAALWAWRRNRRVGRRVRAVMAQLEQGPQVRADRATAGVLEPDAVLQPAERSQVQEADPV